MSTGFKVNSTDLADIFAPYSSSPVSENVVSFTYDSSLVNIETTYGEVGGYTTHVIQAIQQESTEPVLTGSVNLKINELINITSEHDYTYICVAGGAGGYLEDDTYNVHGGGGGGHVKVTYEYSTPQTLTVNIGGGGAGGTPGDHLGKSGEPTTLSDVNDANMLIEAYGGRSNTESSSGLVSINESKLSSSSVKGGGKGGTGDGNISQNDRNSDTYNTPWTNLPSNIRGTYSGGGGGMDRATVAEKCDGVAGGYEGRDGVESFGRGGEEGDENVTTIYKHATSYGAGGGGGGNKYNPDNEATYKEGGNGAAGVFIVFYKVFGDAQEKAAATGLYSGSNDLNDLLQKKIEGSTAASATGYMVDGSDLSTIFEKNP